MGERVTLWRAPHTGWTDWRQIGDENEEWMVSTCPGAESCEAVLLPKGTHTADLARELYEALERIAQDTGLANHARIARAALVRYEREVGNALPSHITWPKSAAENYEREVKNERRTLRHPRRLLPRLRLRRPGNRCLGLRQPMTEIDDDKKIHARWWTEEYPGWWRDNGELELDLDDLTVGASLLKEFAKLIGPKLADGTHFRISRKGVMQDFFTRAGMAWTVAPL